MTYNVEGDKKQTCERPKSTKKPYRACRAVPLPEKIQNFSIRKENKKQTESPFPSSPCPHPHQLE